MALNGNEKLKIKTVSDSEINEEAAFSPEEMNPYEVAEALESDLINGKTDRQVKKARRLFGANVIRSEFRLSFRDSLKNQVKGLSSLFLLVSSLIMYIFRPQETTYAVMAAVIAIIIFLNAFTEFRAGLALRLPKKYSSLKARVIRNGVEAETDSRSLVPGDIITLEDGMMVPADCRLIDELALTVLESHVGKSESSVGKNSRYIARNGFETVCENMIYAGSIITSGHCSAIVCRTGKDTLIRRMHCGNENNVPDMLKYVSRLCRFVSIASAAVCFALPVLGVIAHADITDWFICSLAIGASSLCDSALSLSAASLAFGAKKMAEDGMVVKNYNCIQTLARTNTIACGKNLAFPPKRIQLTGLYFSCRSYDREKRPNDEAVEMLKLLLACSDVRKITPAERRQKRGLPEYKGLPLDDAIVDYFGEWGKTIGSLHDDFIRLDAEYTLSGDISRMMALHNGKNIVIVRGSPENILSRCAGYTLDGTDYKLSDFTRKKILSAAEDMARTNSFLLAVACGETESESLRDINAEQRLIFKGIISFSGSLDPGVAEAVYRCKTAGIETILNSNDAYYTALNSAKSAGIIDSEEQIINAEQIRKCDRGLFIANAPDYNMFLNIDDAEWLDIINLRRQNNRVTAVTAERINELPIMKEADVSVVPESSPDTLRQTADALLLGRGINLIADGILNAKTVCRRIGATVSYLPVAIIVMVVASAFSVLYNQTPALRAQDVLFGGIIFNLFNAVSLAFEPRNAKNIKDSLPFSGEKPRLNDFIYPLMFSVGGGILLFIISSSTASHTCTMISLSLLLFLYACSLVGHGGIFTEKRFGNRLLYLCGIISLGITAFLVLTKPGHTLFGYGVPSAPKIIISLVLTVSYFIITQTARFFLHSKPKPKKTANAEEFAEDVSEILEFDASSQARGVYDFEKHEDEFSEFEISAEADGEADGNNIEERSNNDDQNNG